MKILVTGATGFVGRHVVDILVKLGHEIVTTSIDIKKAQPMPWFDQVTFIPCDLHDPGLKFSNIFETPDVFVHLCWPGLPNYEDLFHFEINLPMAYKFLKAMVLSGTKQLLITGTCFEYGMQSGPLSEDMPTFPSNSYGLAKDTLRKFLESLKKEYPFKLQWVRLFYLYGPGQNKNSLMAQLDNAIDNGQSSFNMTGGEQLRDYLSIIEVARRICYLIENSCINGIINCCSNKPISVRSLVEEHIQKSKSKIKLNLGYYSYPNYEPMAFWGNSRMFEKYKMTE